MSIFISTFNMPFAFLECQKQKRRIRHVVTTNINSKSSSFKLTEWNATTKAGE